MAFRVVAVLLATLACLCDARPRTGVTLFASTDVDLAIIGGSNASPGAWPWQLSLQRQSGLSWSHTCGASLLSTRAGLCAAHCVDGTAAGNLRIIAGLHDQTVLSGTQTVNLGSYTMHSGYQVGTPSYANDISILNLAGTVSLNSNVALLTLPPNNVDQFVGDRCVLTGWGRTSSSNTLPDILQQATETVLSTTDCQNQMGTIGSIWDGHICVKDPVGNSGACNGDSGGPLNCPYSGGYYVSGVTSWVVSSALGNCLPDYPQVYTRTSYYLSWIANNTP